MMFKSGRIIALIGLFLIIGVAIFTVYSFSKQKDFSFGVHETVSASNKQFLIFNQQTKIESPELCLVQKSAILSSTPPIMVKPKVLGDIIGSVVQDSERKDIIEYVVQSGDTLSGIAANFGITLDTLFWANDLSKNSVLKIGKKLVIPPVSGVIHLVKPDDAVSIIAEIYKVKPEKIIAFNNLSSPDDIFIGDILMVPDGVKPTIVAPTKQIALANSYFIFPTTGRISRGPHWYNAIDVANKCGTPIHAAAGGTVQKTGYIKTGGLRITILHTIGTIKIPTYYGHLSKVFVAVGQKVSQGDLIGLMGNTGYTIGPTGCHLHFDVLSSVRNPLAKYPLGSYIKY